MGIRENRKIKIAVIITAIISVLFSTSISVIMELAMLKFRITSIAGYIFIFGFLCAIIPSIIISIFIFRFSKDTIIVSKISEIMQLVECIRILKKSKKEDAFRSISFMLSKRRDELISLSEERDSDGSN